VGAKRERGILVFFGFFLETANPVDEQNERRFEKNVGFKKVDVVLDGDPKQ